MSFKNYFIFCIFLLSTTLHAQLEYGVKVGAILNASGSITNAPSDFSSIESAKESLSGYYLGGFIEIDLPLIYLRPELQFSSLNTDVENLSLSQTRIEAPISIGLNVLPLISVFAGPSLPNKINIQSPQQ